MQERERERERERGKQTRSNQLFLLEKFFPINKTAKISAVDGLVST
jgi:hypothetical protein